MPERVYCLGVVGFGRTATLCERAQQCQRWTEFQLYRGMPCKQLHAEPLLCDQQWLSHVPVEAA